MNENAEDKNFVDKDFWSCTLSLLCGWGAPEWGSCRVSPLFLLNPPFTLEITLNLGTGLQGWAGCSSEFLHLLPAGIEILELWGGDFRFLQLSMGHLSGEQWLLLCSIRFLLWLQSISFIFFFCIWLHVLRQGSLCNEVDLNSVHCRGLHINFLL